MFVCWHIGLFILTSELCYLHSSLYMLTWSALGSLVQQKACDPMLARSILSMSAIIWLTSWASYNRGRAVLKYMSNITDKCTGYRSVICMHTNKCKQNVRFMKLNYVCPTPFTRNNISQTRNTELCMLSIYFCVYNLFQNL